MYTVRGSVVITWLVPSVKRTVTVSAVLVATGLERLADASPGTVTFVTDAFTTTLDTELRFVYT